MYVTENHNHDETDGALSRRGLMGATLAATGGLGLLSMTGNAAAQQNNIYLRDAYIGDSANRTNQLGGRGWLYFETDTGSIYYDTGSGWTDLGVSGSGDSSTSVTVIDDTQSTSTNGSSVVYVDTSSSGTDGPITVTTDSANEQNGAPLEVYDVGEAAGQNPITINNSNGEFVTKLNVDRAYVDLIYQDTRWLIKTSDSEGIWNTESGAVPDTAIEQFDARELNLSDQDTVTEWAGGKGVLTLTGGDPIYVADGINGNASVDFNRTDSDLLDGDLSSAFSQRVVQYSVVQTSNTSDRQSIIDGFSQNFLTQLRFDANEFLANASNSITGSSSTTDPILITVDFNGSSSSLRVNGTEVATGDIGSNSLDGITMGGRPDGTESFDGLFGFHEPHDGEPSNGLQTREQEIADEWGITL